MTPSGNPLLDQFNRDGIVTPGIQRAMDIFKSKMGAQFQSLGSGAPEQGATPALRAPDSQSPVPKFQMPAGPGSSVHAPSGKDIDPGFSLNVSPGRNVDPGMSMRDPWGGRDMDPGISMRGAQGRDMDPGIAMNPALRPPGSAPPVPQLATPGQQSAAPATPSPHQQELTRLTTGEIGKSGMDQMLGHIQNPWLRTAAAIPLKALDAIGTGFFPRLAMGVPGTTLHHQMAVNNAKGLVDFDDQVASSATKRHLEEAQATEQESLPAFHQAQTENAATKVDNDRLKAQAETDRKTAADALHHTEAQGREATTLAQHGFKRDDQGNIVALPYEEMSQEQQAVHDLKAAQGEAAEATKALREAQAKNVPQAAALAQKRLDSAREAHGIALRRLNLSEQTYEARYHGTEGGAALPGSMIGDDGKPVGTAFQQNVRPTGQERNKADLASSAAEQIKKMREIIGRRPDIFGPLAGRKTNFDVWLGSQDEDAQKYISARTIAADHAAGVFGGRSEHVLKELNDALGHFKDNPAAALAGIDQFDKANALFINKGTVRTASGPKDAQSAAPPTITTKEQFDKLPSGTVYMEDGKKYRKP